MDSNGAVLARFPDGGVDALDEAIRAARTATKRSSPLKVLTGDPSEHRFALVDRWGRSDNMPMWAEGPNLAVATELAELSRLVGEVFAFYELDEGLTMGIYGAWKNGALVRDLQWMDNAWQVAEGEPQSWEKPLFSEESLARALENAREDGMDEAEVRARFAPGVIAVGSSFPRPERIFRNFIAVHPAPLYGLVPWTKRSLVAEQQFQS